MSLPARILRRFFPNGWLDCLRQIVLFAAAYYGYRIVRGMVDGRASAAYENARHIIGFERNMHVFFEPAVQSWASNKPAIIDAASWLYINSHFMITVTALVFIYLFRNSHFYFVRNMFMIAMFLALVGYVVYPTAPPRFLPEWGFSDSVANFTGVSADNVAVNALFNPYAAVPSMHVAFALMIGIPLARLVRPKLLKVLWYLYPLVVTFVVISTGNHFWTDALLGACTAGISAYSADRLLGRARPHAWSFGRPRAEAAA